MATHILPHVCPICKDDILPGQCRRIIGLDQSRWPHDPPCSIFAHTDCVQAVHFTGAVLIRPGQTLSEIIPARGLP